MNTDKKDCETIVTVNTLTGTCGHCHKRVTADFVLDSRTLPRCPKCGRPLTPCQLCFVGGDDSYTEPCPDCDFTRWSPSGKKARLFPLPADNSDKEERRQTNE